MSNKTTPVIAKTTAPAATQSNGQSSAASKANEIEPTYIVTLKPNQPIQTYQAHLNFVKAICQNQPSSIPGKPAGIAKVFHYPPGSRAPKLFCYVARFNANILQQVRRTAEFKVVEMNGPISPKALQHSDSRSLNVALELMSQSKDNFKTHVQERKTAIGEQREMPWHYSGLANRGAGSTIYIIDTGFDERAMELNEINPARLRFYDAKEFYRRGVDPATDTIDDMNARDTKAWSDPPHAKRDYDDDDKDGAFHGTNVTLFAGSSKRGTAERADLVVFNCAETKPVKYTLIEGTGSQASEKTVYLPECVFERQFIIAALYKILSEPMDKKWRAVVNCSFAKSKGEKEGAINDALTTLYSEGVQTVGAAGNEKSLITPDTYHSPGLLDFAFCTGNMELDRESHKSSNWIKMPSDHMIWAFGTDLPGWHPIEKTRKMTGTSFAAPLLSGVIAGLLSPKTAPVDFSQLREELDELIRYRENGVMACLYWGDG